MDSIRQDSVPLQSTVFLIPNLHCPSCATHVEDALSSLNPRPVCVTHSIIDHVVTVSHPVSLSVETMASAIEAGGYDVHSVLRDPGPTEPVVVVDSERAATQAVSRGILNRAFSRWASQRADARALERRRKKHMESCELCRAEKNGPDTRGYGRTEGQKDLVEEKAPVFKRELQQDGEEPLIAIHTSPAVNLYEITLSIGGMSCSSCVGKIRESLDSKPWVKSVGVDLLSHSVSLLVYGERRTDEITTIIRNLGYDATVESIEKKGSSDFLRHQDTGDVWKASYTVGGMTCSSCVANITDAFRECSWVRNVDVNLIAKNAVVVFSGRHHLDRILKVIEDLGYEATLDDVEEISGPDSHTGRRIVDIRIDGMYCEHCPFTVTESLQVFEHLIVEKPPTTDTPLLRVSYVPSPPSVTIRHILKAISESDPAFNPSVHRPLSLDERARRMRMREQQHILYRALLSVVVAIPTFIIGIAYMKLVSPSNAGRVYLMHPVVGRVNRAEWALFAMATPVYFFAGDIFHRRTVKELVALWRPGSPVPIFRRFYRFGSMSMLISFGTTIAYLSSIADLGIGAAQPRGTPNGEASYFDSVVFLIMFLLLGRLIEAYSKAKTGDAVASLGKLRPTEALLIADSAQSGLPSDGGTVRIQVDLLESGDVVKVRHGDSPPFDGIIVQGSSKFDESSLTGESVLVRKSEGDMVYSGTVNQGDAVSIRLSGAAGASMLDQIMRVVREGQTRRAPVERVADLITGYFVPVVTLIAITTWIVWLSLGLSGALPEDYRDNDTGGWTLWSLQFAIAVFVIACPCGIGLAAPTALLVGSGLAAKHGILVKGGGEAFQEASDLDCIVFDKTGTLTQGGEPVVTDFQLVPSSEDPYRGKESMLTLLRKLEGDSSHPIAKAVVRFCENFTSQTAGSLITQEIPGKGIKGAFPAGEEHQGTVEIVAGSESLMAEFGVEIGAGVKDTLDVWKREAKSVVLVATRRIDSGPTSQSTMWGLSMLLAVSDPPRPEAFEVISALRQRGIQVWMISGDNPTTARAVGAQVGIAEENIIAGVLPEQKAEKIKYLQRTVGKQKHHRFSPIKSKAFSNKERAIVAMVGDGINDSPALAMADVGIAIGSGSDVAISTAKFVLMTSELTCVLTLTDLSRRVFGRIKVNFLWACAYNLIALPIAAGVLYPLRSNGSHVRLDPVWAALAMALSSISVVISSLLLRSKLPFIGFKRPRSRRD